LYGAFDRYNYGDNLMPIIFQKYIEKYYPDLLLQFEIEYAGISHSNLEKYLCLKTKSIKKVAKHLTKDSAIIVIGGEVLGATNDILHLHMQKTSLTHKIIKKFKQKFPLSYKLYLNSCYSTPWDYPFVINKNLLPDGVKVIYNTVGGRLNPKNNEVYSKIRKRIFSSDYFSVRDSRTFKDLTELDKPVLSPDSVFLLPDVIDLNFIETNIRPDVKLFGENHRQYVFQVAPNKLDCTLDILIDQITQLSKNDKSKVVLLPIGYASGHDDMHILKKINNAIPKETILLNDLNLWEILYIIKNCKAFIGTSLHGVITAMAYGIPHFGINKNISKLDAFLSEWSFEPYNHCYNAANISDLPDYINLKCNKDLLLNAEKLIDKVKQNNEAILEVIMN